METNTQLLLTKEQIQAIKNQIDEQLRIRCFNVETTLELKIDPRTERQFFSLTSTKFNTVPVIHSAIELESFGGGASIDEKDENIINFCVRVSARYEGNRVNLFDVQGFC